MSELVYKWNYKQVHQLRMSELVYKWYYKRVH